MGTFLNPRKWPLRTCPALASSAALGEGLFDQGDAGFEPALGGQDGLGVAGHVEHLDVRAELADPLGDFLAEHLGHDDVGDEQVDLAVVAGGEGEGLGTVRGGDHVVAVAGEDPFGDLAERLLVLDDEDGLALGAAFVGRGFLDRRRRPRR